MSDASDLAEPGLEAPACSLQDGASKACAPQGEGGLLSGGCCSDGEGAGGREMSRPARRARALAGLGFLGLAGAIGARQLPGRVELWPAALVPTWFGVSHLVASVTGYQGCPELGAIPSVMLDRPVATACGPWERIDAWVDSVAGALR